MPTTNGDSSAVDTSRSPSPRRGEQGLPRPALPARACGPGRAGDREEIAIAEALADRGGLAGDRGGSFEVTCSLVTENERDQQVAMLRRCRLVRSRAAAGRARASRPPGRPRPGRRGSCRSRSRHAPRAASRLARDTGGGHARGSPIASSSRPSINVAVVNSSRSSASRGVPLVGARERLVRLEPCPAGIGVTGAFELHGSSAFGGFGHGDVAGIVPRRAPRRHRPLSATRSPPYLPASSSGCGRGTRVDRRRAPIR